MFVSYLNFIFCLTKKTSLKSLERWMAQNIFISFQKLACEFVFMFWCVTEVIVLYFYQTFKPP